MPTIAIIGGGTGGNLLAARLLERAADGQRLNVMLIEARGRAGPHLRAIVRRAESVAPGAFLTRLRGEAVGLIDGPGGHGARIALRSGRVLDVDRAVVVRGSVAAAGIDEAMRAGSLPRNFHRVPSEAGEGELRGAVDALAQLLVSSLAGTSVETAA